MQDLWLYLTFCIEYCQKFLEKLANSANLDTTMGKINLAITGCMGRMGQQLIKSANKDKSTKLVALTENRLINKKIGKGSPKFDSKNLKIENKYLFSSNLKAKTILRWKPQFKLEDGLLETIKYYENE